MTRTVYVNGEYLPETEAKVSIFDRAFLMADGVYEVTSVLDGKLIDFAGHSKRLARSLSELDMRAPCSDEDLLEIHRELVRANHITDGLVYLQVGAVHPVEAGSGRVPRRKIRHQGDFGRRHPLGPPRHQDRAAAVPVHGQDDGQEGGRR